eukprot:6993541-Alexandrium_andersonii.AAC.1
MTTVEPKDHSAREHGCASLQPGHPHLRRSALFRRMGAPPRGREGADVPEGAAGAAAVRGRRGP